MFWVSLVYFYIITNILLIFIISLLRAFSKYTFQDAQDIYDKYIDSSVLPDDIELINPKKCFPILEHSIVFFFFNSKFMFSLF